MEYQVFNRNENGNDIVEVYTNLVASPRNGAVLPIK